MKTLTRLRNRLYCWWHGHNTADQYGFPNECMHCDAVVHEAESVMGRIHRIRWWWWYSRPAWLRREWWKPCPECGKRFGRHNLDVDHTPF